MSHCCMHLVPCCIVYCTVFLTVFIGKSLNIIMFVTIVCFDNPPGLPLFSSFQLPELSLAASSSLEEGCTGFLCKYFTRQIDPGFRNTVCVMMTCCSLFGKFGNVRNLEKHVPLRHHQLSRPQTNYHRSNSTIWFNYSCLGSLVEDRTFFLSYNN